MVYEQLPNGVVDPEGIRGHALGRLPDDWHWQVGRCLATARVFGSVITRPEVVGSCDYYNWVSASIRIGPTALQPEVRDVLLYVSRLPLEQLDIYHDLIRKRWRS
jgi:hypothetical protein